MALDSQSKGSVPSPYVKHESQEPIVTYVTGYRLEVPNPPSLGQINLLERLTELRETFVYLYEFIKGYDKEYS